MPRRITRLCAVVLAGLLSVVFGQTAAWSGDGDGSGTGVAGSSPADSTVWASASHDAVGLSIGGASSACTWTLYDDSAEMPADQRAYPFTDPNGLVWHIYWRLCPTGGTWVEVPDRTPADLLPLALDELRERAVPKPTPILQPLDQQFGWAYVHVPLDFRIAPASWQSVAVTATAGPVWATVTATPQSLSFEPGDSHADAPPAAVCAGTDPIAGYEPNLPGACSYTYRHASSTGPDGYHFTTTTTITWAITWTSSTGAGGALPAFSSQTQQPLAVAEIQSLITCTGPRPAQGGCG